MAAPIDRDIAREALRALYDDVRLAQSRLASAAPGVPAAAAVEQRARAVRALLLEALESLRPQRRVTAVPSRSHATAAAGFGSAEARSYDVLTLRYLERMPVSDMEEELSLERRQVYRGLEEAEARLAAVLSSWVQAGEDEPDVPARRDSLAEELEAIASHPGRVELHRLFVEAVELVEPLAEEKGATISLTAIGESDLVLVDRAMLRQVLVQLLACGIQSGAARIDVASSATDVGPAASVTIRFAGDVAAVERRLADAQRIAGSRGMACELRIAHEAGNCEVSLQLRRGSPVSVLVVEDNPGAVELYRRYLSAGGWQVLSTSDPRAALSIATQTQPDVIVLDLMMPHLDGWTVLRALRTTPETAAIPVLVCSVVEQPELGASLGARAYLTKPVSQAEFLSALRACSGQSR